MSENKPTLGTAIDQIIQALTPFDERERETILGTVCSYLSIRKRSIFPMLPCRRGDAQAPSRYLDRSDAWRRRG